MSEPSNSSLPEEINSVQPGERKITAIIAQKEEFSGPLPHPNILAQYKEQGVLDNILKLVMDANDRENRTMTIQEKYCQMQNELMKSEIKTKHVGFIVENVAYGCVVALVLIFIALMLGLATWYAYKNMYIPASVSFVLTIVFPKLIKIVYHAKKK